MVGKETPGPKTSNIAIRQPRRGWQKDNIAGKRTILLNVQDATQMQ